MAGTISRRKLFGLAGAGAAGVVAGGAIGLALGGSDRPQTPAAADAVEFYGAHQAGILTPAPDRLHFVSFDVTTADREALVRLLKEWTAAAARMTAGLGAGPIGAVDGPPEAPPDDTREALGL